MTQEARKQYFLSVPEKSVKLNHFQIINLKFCTFFCMVRLTLLVCVFAVHFSDLTEITF